MTHEKMTHKKILGTKSYKIKKTKYDTASYEFTKARQLFEEEALLVKKLIKKLDKRQKTHLKSMEDFYTWRIEFIKAQDDLLEEYQELKQEYWEGYNE